MFLPYDHDSFDQFMRGRSRDDFYCGTLLGGCGKILTVRRSEVKKCHFAHRPPVHCRRTEVGEESADHLYIGQALQRWLRRQGHQPVTVDYLDLGSGPGGAIEVRFDAVRRVIRVQMCRLSLRDWRTARERTHGVGAAVHWSYGTSSGLAHNEAAEEGHAIRFECRTVGDTREVYVGTQFKDHSVEWVPLAEAHLIDTGIVTPRLAEHTDEEAGTQAAAPVAFPLLPGSIAFTGSVEVTAQGDENRLYDADVQPRGSGLIRARISLPGDAVQPKPYRLHIIDDIAHLRPLSTPTGPDVNWLIHADGCSPLAEPSDPRWPDLKPPEQLPAPTVVEAAALEPDPAANADRRATSEVPLVQAFRAKLTDLARARGVINWETLVSNAGASPRDFTAADRIRILVAVDYPRADDKPVLSSLVKLRGESPGTPSLFADILTGLGRNAARDQGTLAEVHQRELVSAYAIVRGESTDEVSRSLRAQEECRLAARKTVPAPRTSTVVGNRISARGTVSLFNHNAAFKSVRRALVDAAQHQRCVGWQFLAAAAGYEPEDITESRRIAILVAADRANSASGVLLSSLVIGPGHTPVPYFDTILKQLGRPHGLRPIELGALRKTEQARAFAAYKENPARES
ncbi:competence protein CoiA family protein [Streptomyces sp. NBC_01643]|uniref:competence protein CoiA family protein n=1 Tax=Streptomyces sp. NBC_01643 TaxID=2975906 RepID=UPI0038700699|nr:competence protein CoiA [Streptomyces sp. NBC_01643]